MKRPNASLFALAICMVFVVPRAFANDLRLDYVDNHPYVPAPGSVNLLIGGTNLGPGIVSNYICYYSDGQNTFSDTVWAAVPSDPQFGYPFGRQLSNPINVLPGDVKEVIIWVKSAVDPNPSNDTIRFTLYGLSFVPDKVVVVEDGEGTRCEWCPRGYVMMDSMIARYGDSVAMVAIHTYGGDPMEFSPYKNWIWTKIAGIPGATIDRIIDNAPTAQYNAYIAERLALAPPASVEVTSTVDWIAEQIVIDIEVKMAAELTGDYRVNVIVMEHGVTGTTPDYDQRNAYANGQYGPMGIYSSLPDPVPAAQMVYNYVARALGGGIDGDPGSLPNHLPVNSTHTYQYKVSLDSIDNPVEMEVIAILLDHSSGEILNAGKGSVITGIEMPTPLVFKLFPNPATDVVYIELPFRNESKVAIRVFDAAGRLVARRSYSSMNDQQLIPIPTHAFKTGLYLVVLESGEVVQTAALVVK